VIRVYCPGWVTASAGRLKLNSSNLALTISFPISTKFLQIFSTFVFRVKEKSNPLNIMRSKITFLFISLFSCAALTSSAQYIYTFAGTGFGAGTGTGDYTGDGGLAPGARLNSCTGVAFDGAGNIYIADRANNVVRKVNTSGIITTFAGTGTAGYSGDYGLATAAKLNQPYNIAADAPGNVYIADYGNNVIRKVSAATGNITTYAGNGTAGYSGDAGPASVAKLRNPTGVALDTMGNLFIADANNNAVRKVYAGGTIVTIAGTGTPGYTGDGGNAGVARLNYPVSVAVDPFQQVYIADYFNNAIRKIDTNGNISTFAGNGSIGYSGDGFAATTAQMHYPAGVSVFSFGNVYIADQGNNMIRFVNSAGTISTFAGKNTNGYAGDGGLAVNAELSSPKGIAVDAQNRLFIADYDNNVIRVVKANTAVGYTPANTSGVRIFPNPSNGSINIELPANTNEYSIAIIDVLGRTVITKTAPVSVTERTFTIACLLAGNYLVKVTSGKNTYTEKVAVW
jgi:Secretion system C-terminal sorting domain/NHL repeat